MTFGAERSVSVRLSWSMSADLDIPVNHYKLSWSLSDHTMPPKLKRRQTANGVTLINCPCLCPFTFSLSLSLFHFLICWIVPKTPQGLSSPSPSFSKPQQIRYLSAKKCKINNSGLGLWSHQALNSRASDTKLGWYSIASPLLANANISGRHLIYSQKQHINSSCSWEKEISQ